MAQIDTSVFRSYDIRGVYPAELDEGFARLLGRALVEVLGVRRVVAGHDARLSSPALYAALAAGLEDAGAEFAGLGLCPTELVYYAAGSRPELDLGVMVTASHNPPEYNGFKVVTGDAAPIPAREGLADVLAHMQRAPAPHGPCPDPGRTLDAAEDYADFALQLVGRPEAGALKVVVDAGNGVGGALWDWLGERLGLDPVRMNCEPDGRFPAHHPDPSKRENVEPLVARVLECGADLGFCYDGDADRVVVVLADGHIVDGSEMTACLAERFRGRRFGAGHTTSRKALDLFHARGDAATLVPVGHAKIKALMRRDPGMAFAGEDAGHYYYRGFFCCDSSLVTTLHALHLAAQGWLAPLIAELPGPWVRPAREPAFGFDELSRAAAVCRDVALTVLDHHPDPLEVTVESRGAILRNASAADVQSGDGTRVDYADWWLCVRPSGTEPIARLALEARTDELLSRRTDAVSALFRRLG